MGGALGVFAYVTGNVNFSDYLGIPYVAGTGEILVFCAAMAGAGLGFLWFNTYPAQVFMGDIGALSLGRGTRCGRRRRSSGNRSRHYGRRIRYRNAFGHHSGGFLQINWQARFPHGATAPSLRTQGLGRAKSHCSILDYHGHPRVDRSRESENTMNAASKTATTGRDLVLGLGATGLSIARYLRRNDCDAVFLDSRDEPPGIDELNEVWPDADVKLGTSRLPAKVDRVIVSPGIEDSNELLAKARKKKLEIVSDIEVFARAAQAPFVAITGSNGKSTVTTLLYHMCRAGWP